MPRAKLNDRVYRERDLNAEIEKCKTLRGYDYDRDLAKALGISPAALCRKRKDLEGLTVKELLTWIRVLKLPGEAVRAFLGIK